MGLNHMPEPTSTATGGTLVLYKIITVSLPVLASLIAFWLGIRFVPIRKEYIYEDMINRIIACLISSGVLGITMLTLLYNHYPTIFLAARNLAVMAHLPEAAGFFTFTGCVLIVCATPGPWIVAAVFLWLEKRKGKDIGELYHDFKHDIHGGKRDPHQSIRQQNQPGHLEEDVTCEGCATGNPYPVQHPEDQHE